MASESDVLRRDPLPESGHGRGNATRESVGLDPGLASSFAIAGARAPQGGEGTAAQQSQGPSPRAWGQWLRRPIKPNPGQGFDLSQNGYGAFISFHTT